MPGASGIAVLYPERCRIATGFRRRRHDSGPCRPTALIRPIVLLRDDLGDRLACLLRAVGRFVGGFLRALRRSLASLLRRSGRLLRCGRRALCCCVSGLRGSLGGRASRLLRGISGGTGCLLGAFGYLLPGGLRCFTSLFAAPAAAVCCANAGAAASRNAATSANFLMISTSLKKRRSLDPLGVHFKHRRSLLR